jgi:hypothetical protein
MYPVLGRSREERTIEEPRHIAYSFLYSSHHDGPEFRVIAGLFLAKSSVLFL